MVDLSSICSVARKLLGMIVYQLRPLPSCGGDALSDGEHVIQKKQTGPDSSGIRQTVEQSRRPGYDEDLQQFDGRCGQQQLKGQPPPTELPECQPHHQSQEYVAEEMRGVLRMAAFHFDRGPFGGVGFRFLEAFCFRLRDLCR